MRMFDYGWWNCFNTFANNCYMTKGDRLSACYEVLNGAGITKREADDAIRKNILYGAALDIVKEYITNN